MRVATYNIRHGAPPRRRADHPRMLSALRSLGADVIALQEVDRRVVRSYFRDQARLAARATGTTDLFAAARPLGPFGRYGNALLLPPGPHDHAVLKLHSVGEQRIALFARVRLDGIWTTVVCAHLQNSTDPRPGRAPAQLSELLGALRQWPRPWIVMGDLNQDAESVLPRFEEVGLTAVPTGPTFPSWGPRVRIDWVGVRDLVIRSAEVPALDASDHLPVVVDLEPRP